MGNEFIKAEVVLAQMLGVLERDTVLAQFTWRDVPDSAFKGAKGDTVTLKVPAYTTARRRTLRGTTPITVDELDETKVDVTLDTHVYKAVGVTDAELTLDIANFGEQVTAPVMSSVVREVDDVIGETIVAADPEVEVEIDPDDPYPGLVDARIALNNHRVPKTDRYLGVGSGVEAAILKSDRFVRFDSAGASNTDALRDAVIGRIAGFTVVSVDGFDPELGVAAHKTAFPLGSVVPVVPAGAPWGETRTWRGFGLRTLRHYDPHAANGPRDVLLADVFIGVGVTKDRGTLDADGKFQPSVDGTDTPILVRAVKLGLPGALGS